MSGLVVSEGIRRRSVTIGGHRTSVSVEDEFWQALKAIASEKGVSLNRLIAEIDQDRQGNLSSAIRVFVLAQMRSAAERMRQ